VSRVGEGAEDGEVFDIFVEVGGLGSFEAAGVLGEARIVDDVSEGLTSDFALADACMAIDPGAEVGFGVVQVEGEDLVEADEPFDLVDGEVPTGGGSYIVTGGKEMGGVEAESEA
jgi:hypothetical protein